MASFLTLSLDPSQDVDAVLASVQPLAEQLGANLELQVCLTGDQFTAVFGKETTEPAKTAEPVTKPETKPAPAPVAAAEPADAGTRIRRTKEEIAAGLTLDQAVAFRASGDSDPAKWLKAQTGAAEEVDEPETTGVDPDLENPAEASEPDDLADLTSEPAPEPKTVTYEDVVQGVKLVNASKGRQALADYLSSKGKKNFQEFKPEEYARVVADLKKIAG